MAEARLAAEGQERSGREADAFGVFAFHDLHSQVVELRNEKGGVVRRPFSKLQAYG
jgi:hypothetical protein